MKRIPALSVVIAITMLCAPSLTASTNQSGFSALKGVQAQALSADEMQAISGELNAYDIAAALYAAAAKLDKFPRLQAATIRLADYYQNNAEAINAAFMKLGIFTPCQTCQP